LSWNAQASTCQFAINCTKQGLESATCDVTLTLTDPTPSPTSIMINGDETLTGVVGIAGITHYEAIDNAGNDITNNSN
jgi:hypothetical protein